MSYKNEKVKPYNPNESKTEQVRTMFSNIAQAYDFMNHAMTFGIDKIWRRKAVNMVGRTQPKQILDVATGTGDFAIDLYRRIQPQQVVGLDLTPAMLQVAERKVQALGLNQKISFIEGDCLQLPFDDNSFDAVTVAFGVRNFESMEQGYIEMLRVLRPGGMLCVIELSTPGNPIIRALYNLYALHIIPAIGGLKSGDASAYRYLPESIAAVPKGEQMLKIMRRVGYERCQVRTLTLGTCSIYTGHKPE